MLRQGEREIGHGGFSHRFLGDLLDRGGLDNLRGSLFDGLSLGGDLLGGSDLLGGHGSDLSNGNKESRQRDGRRIVPMLDQAHAALRKGSRLPGECAAPCFPARQGERRARQGASGSVRGAQISNWKITSTSQRLLAVTRAASGEPTAVTRGACPDAVRGLTLGALAATAGLAAGIFLCFRGENTSCVGVFIDERCAPTWNM